jgi:hypothetical protein
MRAVRAALAAAVAITGLWAAQLALPNIVHACSCMPPGPDAIGTFADDPNVVVFVGTIGAVRPGADNMGRTQGTLTIERVFTGTVPQAQVAVVGGGGADCTIHIEPGQRMITAAHIEGGTITPGLCMPYGDPVTPEGQRLIAEAERAYGPGIVPGAPGPGDDGSSIDLAALAIGLVGGLVILISVAAGLAVLRRGPAA